MQTTRGRIIELLRGADGATVDDITSALALAPATVRRHLDVLLRDGLMEMRSQRVPLGRPHFVFTLTEHGRESVPAHQIHLVAAVIDVILALSPDDTRGCSGKEVASLTFERLADHLLQQCRGMVTAPDLAHRVEQTLEVLSVAGLDFELASCDEGYIVCGTGCPCRRLLTDAGECGHEPQVLSGLIGTRVERVEAPEFPNSRAYLVRTGT